MSDNEQPSNHKKRRVQRACDACRLKKRACDGLRMSEKKCTQCITNGLSCTFAGALVKRKSDMEGPAGYTAASFNNYVEALETRLGITEQLLEKAARRKNIENSPTELPATQWSANSPMVRAQRSDPALNTASGWTSPTVVFAALNIRGMNAAPPAPHGDDLAHIDLVEDIGHLTLDQVEHRFQGKSSDAMLVKAAVKLREGYEHKDVPWTGRRLHYWTFNAVKHRVPHIGPLIFPEQDLLSDLINLYFLHQNLYYPVLHRPTFERSIADNLHIRDSSFGAVVLLVCAIASRYSDDTRLDASDGEPLRRGWRLFDQVPFGLDHVFEKMSIYHLQTYCLAAAFLEHTVPAACWTLIGIGLRIAQDVGAHRHRDGPPTLETQLWKRAFWVLVTYDRQVSMALGRACATQAEDVDVDFPIECDDEFFENDDPALRFVQPKGKPSLMAFFVRYARLSNILGFSLKMLYSLNKTKQLHSYNHPGWEEDLVVEIDSALNAWVDDIPSHLRWDPRRKTNTTDDNNNNNSDLFLDQSVLLYCSYYLVQMTIHRPFIPMIRKGRSTTLPSVAICTNAARSCSHFADISRQRKGKVPIPALIGAVSTSGIILLLNVWDGERTGLPPHLNTSVTEVQKCMNTLRACEKMWQNAALFYDILHGLSAIKQGPLSTRFRPLSLPSSVDTDTTNQVQTTTTSSKRPREETLAEQHPPPRPPASTVLYPPHNGNVYLPMSPISSQPNPSSFPPTYTAELGKYPVLHHGSTHSAPHSVDPSTMGPIASNSTWYPTQSASPFGAPEFMANGLTHNNVATNYKNDLRYEAQVFPSPVGYELPPGQSIPVFNGHGRDGGLDVGEIGNEVMAMWANGPANFEVNDWEVYLNVMNELSHGLDAPAAML